MLKILLPSDGSINAQHAVRHVIREFRKNPALELHVLNVQPPFSRHVGRFTDRLARLHVHQEQAQAALRPVRRALDSSGVPYVVHTEIGDRAECIAESARRLQCHRIIMSTARKSALHRLLGQSVSNEVIRQTTVPVELIAGEAPSPLEKIGIPAGLGTGALLVWMAAD